MKLYIQLFIVLLPLAVFGQSSFTINARVPSFTNGDKIYLFYRVNDVKFFDSTVVQNNAFAFKGTVTGIGIGYICRNDNPITAEILYDQQIIYIESGNILIANADSLKNAVITGTKLNQDNGELSGALKTLQTQFIEANNAYDALPPAKQAEVGAVADLRAKLKIINSKMEPIRLAFIKAHLNSYISLITLNSMINNTDIFEVEKAYNDLTLSLKKSGLGVKVGKLITFAKQSRIGVTATDFTLINTEGKPVKLSDFRGKYILIDFWASWCLPCRQENPNVKAAYEQYKANGFTVLGVSIDDKASKNAWLAAIKNDGLLWSQVLDSDKKVKNFYGVTTIPANVLIDPSGKIIARNIKDKVLQNTLANLIKVN
ncbi:hypothetical protein A0256_18370 [Mucilaginibacter sp. PAMC 26640]|nr:hypothetical protein A0256_18370 [Mucilaginibacter sp. PAMC 26640]